MYGNQSLAIKENQSMSRLSGLIKCAIHGQYLFWRDFPSGSNEPKIQNYCDVYLKMIVQNLHIVLFTAQKNLKKKLSLHKHF
ncbi:hypothetical protein XELAEV_18017786mg [Xenopus laevis]|uniref:Uncharacterized protein n=1 Tax=Xenopus laevis TaxID=8355 RepID=A0A974DBT0_XENLA|nr:hypothetical protein XELAEV_18017786mg [Xenopus laevis]